MAFSFYSDRLILIGTYFFLDLYFIKFMSTHLVQLTINWCVKIFYLSHFAEFPNAASIGLSKAALGSILASSIAGAILLSVVATTLIVRRRSRHRTVSKRSCKSFIFGCMSDLLAV